MIWIFIVALYVLIGAGVLIWFMNREEKINPKSVMLSDKMLILPDLNLLLYLLMCLLWPFFLFSEIKHRRRANNIGNNDIG